MTHYLRTGKDIDRGLVGYWKLDDLKLAGATKAIDRAKFNDGTITGATNTEGINGLNADAMFFDGVDDVVELPNASSEVWDGVSALSVSLWVKPTILDSTNRVIFQHQETTNSIKIRIDTSNKLVFTRGSSGKQFGDTLELNKLYNLILTASPSTDASPMYSSYINGVLIERRAYSFGNTDVANILLGTTNGFLQWFGGNLQNIRFYNRELTAGEASKIARLRL